MNTAVQPGALLPQAAEDLFSRVIAGADGTDAGFVACRQAGRLVAPDGVLEIVAVEQTLAQKSGETLRKARTIAGVPTIARLVDGAPPAALMHEAVSEQATLVVIGSHGHGRLSGILVGGVAGELVHRAPCSVMIARPPVADALFPRSIVVGIDGSPQSDAALAVAEHLSRRFGAGLRIICALDGKGVSLARAHLRAAFVETPHAHPVGALIAASQEADILVVGSRGLHGLRAIGSVSDRTAHRAPCSVLVVRGRNR